VKQDICCNAQFIKTLRKALGITQEAFAKCIGVSFTSVNRWENGQTKPSKLAMTQIEALHTKIKNCKPKKNTANNNKKKKSEEFNELYHTNATTFYGA
jgi:putative transcriptional regulator